MSDLQELVERQDLDPEMMPSIISVDARVSIAMRTKAIITAVSRVAALVPVKELIPGTSMMLIEGFTPADSVPYIRFSTSDGSQWIQVVVDSDLRVFTPGAAVVPAKKILEALKLAPEAVVKLQVVDRQAILISGRARWTFSTPLSDQLNTTPVEEVVSMTEMPAGELKRALRAILPAVATSPARPAFSQAHMADSCITATDGARVHQMTLESLPKSVSIDIPARVIARAVDLLGTVDDEETISLGANDRRVHLHVGDSRIVAQRVLLPFPDIDRVLVSAGMSNADSFVLPTEKLQKAVQRVRINSDPDYSSLFLSIRLIDKDDWILAIRSRDKDGNEAAENLVVQWTGSKPKDFVVNHKHLTDILNQVHSEYATVRVSVDDTQAQKNPLLVEDGNFRAVLSQMRLDWLR